MTDTSLTVDSHFSHTLVCHVLLTNSLTFWTTGVTCEIFATKLGFVAKLPKKRNRGGSSIFSLYLFLKKNAVVGGWGRVDSLNIDIFRNCAAETARRTSLRMVSRR